MIGLFTAVNRFRDGFGVKTQYALGQSNGGGDGATFATGNEIFVWNSEAVRGGIRSKRIISVWIDASALTNGKNLIVKSGNQQLVIAGGTPGGYFVFALNVPFTVTISTNGGTGTIYFIAYDYNALYTGVSGSSAGTPVQSSGGVSSGGTGGGSGGSSGGGDRGLL